LGFRGFGIGSRGSGFDGIGLRRPDTRGRAWRSGKKDLGRRRGRIGLARVGVDLVGTAYQVGLGVRGEELACDVGGISAGRGSCRSVSVILASGFSANLASEGSPSPWCVRVVDLDVPGRSPRNSAPAVFRVPCRRSWRFQGEGLDGGTKSLRGLRFPSVHRRRIGNIDPVSALMSV
jgi:hypothetical protein